MTSIIGIKISPEYGGGVVLGSDTQLSTEDNEGKFKEKIKNYKKIIYGKNWVLVHAGEIDKELGVFNDILKGKKKNHVSSENSNVEQIINESISNYELKKQRRGKKKFQSYEEFFRKPDFELVNLLNTSTMKNADLDEDEEIDLHSFLLATCEPEGGLWVIDTYGNLKSVNDFNRELDYLCLGSGSDKITSYVNGLLDDNLIDPYRLKIPEAIDIVRGALLKAERDPYSSGPLDLVVLTDKVDYYGDRIRKAHTEAEKKEIKSIKEKY